eukprot:TRINITY_DN35475_c0_g1_i1.p1 TRINITY_DN35475_c0_g1~~TRINITY_DN35475_c0_g1_i1.p1  ORF type:complete len:792 (+),score=122.63 TRINITY_DN35475_c0_g1_i1:112-2487(+)
MPLPSEPLVTIDASRKPKDLEARLHLAWLRSQLKSSSRSSKGRDEPPLESSQPTNIDPNGAGAPTRFRSPPSQPPFAPQAQGEWAPLASASRSSTATPADQATSYPGGVGSPTFTFGRVSQWNTSLQETGRAQSVSSSTQALDSPLPPFPTWQPQVNPSFVTSNLNPALENLWDSVRHGPPSESTESSILSGKSELFPQDEELLAYDMFAEIDATPPIMDFNDEDVFKGLEDLSDAFAELEQLLPHGEPRLEGTLAAVSPQQANEEAQVPEAQDLTAEQRSFLRDFVADFDEQEQLQEDNLWRDGPWNGIPAPEMQFSIQAMSPGISIKSSDPCASTSQNNTAGQKSGKRSYSGRGGDEGSTAESNSTRGVPRTTSSSRAGAQAATRREVAAAASISASTESNPIELLVKVANAIVAGEKDAAHKYLEQLHDVASIYGDASQRLSAYFLEGLTARITGEMPVDHPGLLTPVEYKPPDCARHLMQAFTVLVTSSPYLTFGQVTVNCAILEAFMGASHVHIVDFGIGHGLQWPPLFQALAARPGGPPHVRMTGIDLPTHGTRRAFCVLETGFRMEAVAKKWGIPFKYDCLASRLEDVKPEQIEIYEGEVVAVNCALRLHLLLDEAASPSDPRSTVLRTICSLNPSIFTMVAQHTNHNSPFFLSRFYEALYYYAGLFDSIDASVPSTSTERRVFEQQVLGKAIVNVVACEGPNRVERQEAPGQAYARVVRAGFAPRVLSQNVTTIATELLKTYRPGYGMKHDAEAGLVLTWQEQPLLAVSAWQVAPLQGQTGSA